jgi:hypothetical protein
MILFGRMIWSEKSATFRDHAVVRSHDLVRKVAQLFGIMLRLTAVSC